MIWWLAGTTGIWFLLTAEVPDMDPFVKATMALAWPVTMPIMGFMIGVGTMGSEEENEP